MGGDGPEGEEELDRFLRLNDRVFSLYGDGRLAEALTAVEDEAPLLPGWRSRTAYWRACLLSILGRPGEAMAELRKGLDAGLWWRPDWLTTDHDLDPLWDDPGFGEVVEESGRRQAARNANRREEPLVAFVPPDGEPRALLLALPMYGVTARASARHWGWAARRGVAVTVAESTWMQADGRPCWDDDAAARRDVEAATRMARTRYGIEGPLVLAGASQGGMRAVEYALLGKPVAPLAFIGVVAGLADPDLLEGAARGAADRGIRGWLLTGDQDAARQAVELLHAQLTAAGLECRLDVIPGLGHTFPQDFGERLPAVLPYLLNG